MISFPFYQRVALLCVGILLVGCSYHGQVRRNLYQTPPYEVKIPARVMVVADKFLQRKFTFDDENITPVKSYEIKLADGAAVATADALGTLFSDVSVDLYQNQAQYDLIAEVNYTVSKRDRFYEQWQDTHSYVYQKRYWVPQFHTKILLTLRNPHTQQAVVQALAERSTNFTLNNAAISLYWLNNVTLSLLFPLWAPVYVPAAGDSIRATLEQDLRDCLRRGMYELEENRTLFEAQGE